MVTKKTMFGLLMAAQIAAGCSAIIGTADSDAQPKELSILFVESLRNESSLRGEGLKERAYTTDSATTLQAPNSVYADAFRVYATDTSPARIFVFDRGNRRVTILDNASPPSADEVKLVAPTGIAVDGGGTIFVSDSQQGRVFGFDGNGKLLLVIGSTMGPLTMKTTSLSSPAGLAVDRHRSRLYVTDSQAQQVKVFSTFGDHLFDIGTSEKESENFKFPGSVALDAKGNVFVLDTLRKRVYVYEPDGTFSRRFNLSEAVPGQAVQPKSIAVDRDGRVYITDSVSNNILIFDAEGALMLTWGQTGSLRGDFWSPAGIAIDDQNNIYIADQMNGRIQTFHYSQ